MQFDKIYKYNFQKVQSINLNISDRFKSDISNIQIMNAIKKSPYF